jgi:stringent starvation protein B
MTQLLPPKKEVALALLERSNVDVYLDPRATGVVVPPQFRKEPRLILKIGLNMPVPIPDLRLDDESMSCTLSFNRAKFFCVVPWLSVFAMVGDDGRGMVWPDDVPQELAVQNQQRPAPVAVVEDPPSAPSSPSPSTASSPSSRGGKGKSRLADAAPREAAGPESPRSKRPRKKKEEAAASAPPARPVLVAVPTREKSSPRIEKLEDRRAETTAEREEPRTPAPTPRLPAGSAPPRPKRELPPYLRVVK